MWFISERDILIVHYLAKTRVRFDKASTKMSQASILSFFSSNLAEKGAQKHKSSDFSEGPSATKSLKCLGPSEINMSASEALFLFFWFFFQDDAHWSPNKSLWDSRSAPLSYWVQEWCISKIKVLISSPCKLGKFGAVNHSDVTNLSLRAQQDKLLPTTEFYRLSGWYCGGNSTEVWWAKNPSRGELEWGIETIRCGLKNQPHQLCLWGRGVGGWGGGFWKKHSSCTVSKAFNHDSFKLPLTLPNFRRHLSSSFFLK